MPLEPREHAVRFILRLGRALHESGYPSHRLEEVLGDVADRLGLFGHQFFTTPTSIFASFGPEEQQQTHLLRVESGGTDLGKLAQVDRVGLDVIRGQLTPAEGYQALDAVIAAPAPYGSTLTTLAFGFASAAASRFLGGGPREIAVAGLIGIVIGLLALAAGRGEPLRRVFEPLAAFTASVVATALATSVGPFSLYIATLGGLIVLIPGLTLTIAMTELSSGHLVAGTARLSGAFMIFLGITFGVALGTRLAAAAFGAAPTANPTPLPGWTMSVAVLVASLAFVVILRAQRQDAGWIVIAGALGFAGGRVGANTLGLELGVFMGSLVVGVTSHLYARLRDRPASVVLVPGILLLVPGSIGFRSLSSLINREVVVGVDTAFRMIITAVALVAGLLIANVISPRRRVL